MRYENPHKAFTFVMHGFESIVGPVKVCQGDKLCWGILPPSSPTSFSHLSAVAMLFQSCYSKGTQKSCFLFTNCTTGSQRCNSTHVKT